MNQLKKLMEYRQELANEEQALKEIRKLIQKQINALEIEKLHLECVARKPESPSINNTNELEDDKSKQLDLNVPWHIIAYEEEEEEDDEDL